MKPLTITEVNTKSNEIPERYKRKVKEYDPSIICGSIIDWEDPMGIEKRYIGLYENKLVMFLEEINFLGENFVEIPLENIKGFKPGRAKGFSRKNKIYEIEIFWSFTKKYIDEYNDKKLSGEQFINNLDDMKLASSSAVVEQMMGIEDTCVTLFLGEIKGTGKFNSFGLVALELLARASRFDLKL